MPQERPEIIAVHKQKLEEFLRELELWEPLLKGELKCVVCGATITKDNIGFIIPLCEKIVLCCANLECIYKMRKMQNTEGEENES
jgi:hypothetical protein